MVVRGFNSSQQPAQATLPLPPLLIGNDICSLKPPCLQLRFMNRMPLHLDAFGSNCSRPTSFFTTFVILFHVREMRNYDADDVRGRKDSSSAMSPRRLPCVGCNGCLTKGTKNLRKEDPSGAVTRMGSPLLRYLHGDESSCARFSAHTSSELRCTRSKNTSVDVSFVDSSGHDTAAFVSYHH